jgi:hypothetical protein
MKMKKTCGLRRDYMMNKSVNRMKDKMVQMQIMEMGVNSLERPKEMEKIGLWIGKDCRLRFR